MAEDADGNSPLAPTAAAEATVLAPSTVAACAFALLAELRDSTPCPPLLMLTAYAALPASLRRRTRDLGRCKVVVVGDLGVGKRTWVHRVAKADPPPPGLSLATTVMPASIATNVGTCHFELWVPPSSSQKWAPYGGFRDGYYAGAHAMLLVFDVTSRATYKSSPQWLRDFQRVCPEGTPVVMVGNKGDADSAERQVKPKQIVFPRRKDLPYCEMSAATGANLLESLRQLAESLIGPDLCGGVPLQLFDDDGAPIATERCS